jgi:hypothetical protein
MTKLLPILFLFSLSFAQSDSLPNPQLSPGDTISGAGAKLCTPGYSKSVRHVSGSTKNQIYKLYNITSHKPAEYEIDHLISLELGGSNDPKNLWPQHYDAKWNAHQKDALENKLHQMVCSGQISLHQAQYEISHNWIEAYKKYVK